MAMLKYEDFFLGMNLTGMENQKNKWMIFELKHVSKSNMVKTPHVRTTFWRPDVENVHAVVARNTFPSQKCKKLRVLRLFWR